MPEPDEIEAVLANIVELRPGKIVDVSATAAKEVMRESPLTSMDSSPLAAQEAHPAPPALPSQGELKLPAKGGRLLEKWRLLKIADDAIARGRLKNIDFRIMFYIADAINRDTELCRRQLRTIAKDLGCSRSAVVYSIARLVKSGLVLRHARFGTGNWQMSSDLALNYEAVHLRDHPVVNPVTTHAVVKSVASRVVKDVTTILPASKSLPIKEGRSTARPPEHLSVAPEDRATPEDWGMLREALKKNGKQGD